MKFFGKAGMFLAVVLKVSIVLTVLFALGADSTASAQSRGKVLVVMSGGHLLNLKEGKVYATGYYLNELYVPLAALVKAGYTPVYANPNGDTLPWMPTPMFPSFLVGTTRSACRPSDLSMRRPPFVILLSSLP